MRWVVLGIAFIALLSGLLARGFPVTVVDDRGQEIVIPEPPERIVVVLPLYAEILLDLGAGGRIVGVADSPDNPPEVRNLPRVGPSFSPSVEAIAALGPDLVLGAWGEIRGKLEALGITVLTVGGPGGYIRGIPDVLDAVRTVGKAVGEEEAAEGLVGRICERVVRIEAAVLGLPRPRVAFIYMMAPDSAPYVAGRGTPEGELILRAGGENVFSDLQGFPQVGLEELILRDPEVILTDPNQVGNVLQSEVLSGLAAVREGKVYGFKASEALSTGIADVLRRLAELLHPEVFAG